MDYQAFEKRYQAFLAHAVDEAVKLMSKCAGPVYLYYVPTDGKAWGKLIPAHDQPDGAFLVMPERLDSIPAGALYSRFRSVCAGLPLIGEDE